MNSVGDSSGFVAGKNYLDCLLTGTKENEKKKKTKKGKAKGKGLANEAEKGANSSTPMNSDDTDKLQTEQTRRALEGQRTTQAKVKGQTRRQATKGRKNTKKEALVVVETEATAVPPHASKSDLSNQIQKSLRWEGVLEDPVAEQERIEIYKANRRQRYLAAQRACMHEAPTGNAGSDLAPILKRAIND